MRAFVGLIMLPTSMHSKHSVTGKGRFEVFTDSVDEAIKPPYIVVTHMAMTTFISFHF